MSPAVPPQETTLEGTLERVTFVNEENAWSVVKLAVPGRAELVTAVGNLLGAQPGESLRLTGRWTLDRRYGEQFQVDSYATVTPATLAGIEKYLGSGLVRGIGKVIAARLVEAFGLTTLDVIDLHPERLTEVEGIGPVRQRRIAAAWVEQRHVKDVMVFLQSHGVSPAFAVRIYKAYRDQAIAIVRENPYRLALDIWGIGFKTADRIAARLGVSPTSPARAAAGLLHALAEASDDGHVFLPREALYEAGQALLDIERPVLEGALASLADEERVKVVPLEGPVGAGGEVAMAVYARALHVAEVGTASLVRRLLDTPAKAIAIDVEKALAWFEAKQGLELAEAQRRAIAASVTAKVLVVTGGPGTGKTTLVNGIISILEKKGRRILLAAPTGRAAKRMAEATGREAKTVHRLLEFDPKAQAFQRQREHPLEADVLIVDEASMLDAVLAYDVLKAVPPDAQLVLVGDIDQLPSVGPGSVLRELIASGAVEVVRLQHIFRQAEASQIIVSAHRVNEGKLPLLTAAGAGTSDFYFVEKESPEEVLAAIKDLVRERIPRRFGFDPVGEVQVLTPMQRGVLGAANLNTELQALLNPSGASVARGGRLVRVGDKVMQLRNNYELDVFNGDVGRVEAVDEVERTVDVTFDGRAVTYDAGDLDELGLAYACSIHKAQGSEYPCVVMPVHTQHYVMLQRNLLYTGITRGRRLVVLVGTKRALALAVRNSTLADRWTRLGALLRSGLATEGDGG